MDDNTVTTTREEAMNHINARVDYDGTVVYHDDSMQQDYRCRAVDFDRLHELMHSDNDRERRDAYSFWCTEHNHSIASERTA